MRFATTFSSPVGLLTLASDGQSVTGLWLEGQKYFGAGLPDTIQEKDLPVFEATRAWLDAYFAKAPLPPLPPLSPASAPPSALPDVSLPVVALPIRSWERSPAPHSTARHAAAAPIRRQGTRFLVRPAAGEAASSIRSSSIRPRI